MQLEEFYRYKNKLMEDLLTNEDIVKLISDEIPIERAKELAYTQVFPFEYVPETVQNGHTYVCFDVDIYNADNKTYLDPVLYVWVFSHRSKLRLPEGGVRTDELCSQICKEINGSKYYGLGELTLHSVKRFAPITDYQGKAMTFWTKDFNHLYDGSKSVPVNRRFM